MITLLASIAGFMTSIIPELLKYFRDKQDKKHELNIMAKQMSYSRQGREYMLDEIKISQDLAQQIAIYKTYKTGILWVDALNGTVRPVLAYSFFGLYAIVKFIQYKSIAATAIAVEYMDIIWSIDDQAIFASIISFYFGQRTFNKIINRR